jgi:hypothetical protein
MGALCTGFTLVTRYDQKEPRKKERRKGWEKRGVPLHQLQVYK